MAFQATKEIWWPEPADMTYATSGTQALNGTNLRYAVIFSVPKTGSLTTLLFRTGSVTTPHSITVDLQTLSAGLPSGSSYGGSAPGTLASESANTVYEVTLATPASATMGDLVAMVLTWTSTAGSLNISGNASAKPMALPSQWTYTSSWAAGGSSSAGPLAGCGYGGVYYPIGTLPLLTAPPSAGTAFNSGSGPNEFGNMFVLPFPVKVNGFWAMAGVGSASGVPIITLYDASNTVLAQVTLNGNSFVSTSNTMWMFAHFSTEITLTAGATYRIAISAGDTNNVRYNVYVLSGAQLDTGPGGDLFQYTSRTGSGAWTDVNTKRGMIGVIISALDDGAGGGGGMIVNPGLAGGM